MKKVRIERMTLSNFKGIKNFEISFNGRTRIMGDNGTGKTTLVDAFTWLLFGKDTTGRKDFSIKTFVETDVVHKLDHEVSGVFDIEGEKMTIRRVYKEKWVTRRGTQDPELQGHETLFFWNDVPLQAGEYQSKVDDIISEQTFRMITSPHYFASLKWQERRDILTSIAGNISDSEIASSRLDFSTLFDTMGKKTLDEFKKEVTAKKKKLKDELVLIPARLDEVARNTPEPKNWKWIEDEISTVVKNIAIVDEQLQDSSKIFDEFYRNKQQRMQQIHMLKTKISDIEFEGNKKFNQNLREKSEAISGAKTEIDNINRKTQDDIAEIERLQNSITGFEKEQAALRDEWIKTNSEEFPGYGDESRFVCPTCGQLLPTGDIDAKKAEIKANFEQNKARKMSLISEQGKAYKPQIERCKKRISELESFNYDSQVKRQEQIIEEWEGKHLVSVQSILSGNAEYSKLIAELEALNKQPELDEPVIDNSDLKDKKYSLQNTLDGLKRDLALKLMIEQSDARKNELLRQEKEYAGQLAELEQTEFTIQEFTRAKVDMLESRINGMFDGVKFRMFDTQLNGGLVECCDILVNTNGAWVPWADANSAGRINAGIAIINVLSGNYGQSAPIWIDNAEGITSIKETTAQIIELYVSEAHKTLNVA